MFFLLLRILYVDNSEDIKRFGNHVKKLRLENNLSQPQLAFMADLSETTIFRLEKGKTPNLHTLISIAKALEIPLVKLMDFEME